MFVSPPHIPNIESLSQSTISSLGSGLFGRNRSYANIQQRTKSEVSNTEKVIADNEELYPPSPQDMSNVFAATDLSYRLSYDSVKYKRTWLKAKSIHSYILFSR